MKPFIHDDFLLHSQAAKTLYHDYAKDLPIIDYHCHLDPREIAENKQFPNMTALWLEGDHYKWRAMRNLGIKEEYITGAADDFEKFQAWAKAVPSCIGNPLYHWTHIELKRYFDVDLLLNEDTAKEIWEHCNQQLQKDTFSAQGIIEKSKVKMIGTTDDPIDSLAFHKTIAENPNLKTVVQPAFRPDRAFAVSSPDFAGYVSDVAAVSGISIEGLDDYLKALEARVHYFHASGCRISDHGFEYLPFAECNEQQAAVIFSKSMNREQVTKQEQDQFTTFVMLFLGQLYSSLSWVMQLHIGPLRSLNSRMFNRLGPNTGFDSINDFELAKPLNQFLDRLDQTDQLPKTILYTLNPVHNYVLASAAGNFQSEGIRGKVQFGSGWWFNDQKDGMIRQMTDLANVGLLSTFVGMLTDSRSFLSYTRHEYFRRILCEFLGDMMEKGEAPYDFKLMGKIVKDISYYNANEYFQLDS